MATKVRERACCAGRRAGPGRRLPTNDGSSRTVSRGSLGVRVLGVDPGLTRCGIGVVDGAPGRQLQLVHVEVVRTPSDAPVPERLLAHADAIPDALAAH